MLRRGCFTTPVTVLSLLLPVSSLWSTTAPGRSAATVAGQSTAAATASTPSAQPTSADASANPTTGHSTADAPAAPAATPSPPAAPAGASPPPGAKSWDLGLNKHLIQEGMRVSAFVSSGPSEPVAVGTVMAQLAENIYSVKFEVPESGTIIEVGTRVVAEKEDGKTSAGLVAHVHGDGTFSILYDDDTFDRNVARSRVSVSGGRLAMSHASLAKYEGVVNWIKEAGVQKRIDVLSAAIVLYRRGWRRENMYLLDAVDVHCLSHLNKSVRQGILEAAEDEKGKRRVRRDMQHEVLKEQTHWKYFLQKNSGVLGAFTGCFAAFSVFFWNLKNYRRQQRPAQIDGAVSNMLRSVFTRHVGLDDTVPRAETERLCKFLQSIDNDHPQLIFLTGGTGCGKSTCIAQAARRVGSPHVMVELRGAEKQDPVRAIAKAMGVTSLELCGDLFQFTFEVCNELRRITGNVPVIVLKPKGGFESSSDVGFVFDDALSLVSERRCANIVVELNTETMTNLPHLPRTATFHVEDMTDTEATRYLAHRIDPVAVPEVLANIGTNTIDLDECVSSVRHHGTDVDDYVCNQLTKSIATIRRQPLETQTMLSEVAQQPFHVGVRRRMPHVDEAIQKGFLMYHWENQAWIFRNRLMYESAKIVGAWA